jgi:ADP-heptose:LPS heptosyltransferase
MAPSKILAIKLRAMGDTVLMTAPLLELAKAFPQAEIHALVNRPWVPLLEGLPGIAKVWAYERHHEAASRTRALAKLAFQLRKEKFDLAVNFHASPSSATLAWATGAKKRSIHFHGHQHRNRHSTVEVPGKGILKPIIERDMDAVRALGIHVPAGRLPKLILQNAEVREAEGFLNRFNMKSPILGISLGASRPTKSWPIDRFALLAIEWCQQTHGSAIALAGPTEEGLITQFRKMIDEHLTHTTLDPSERSSIRSKIQSTHQLPIRTLAGIISQISVLVGNDSGPRHIAVSVDTPSVTLFGPENPFEWHPYPVDNHPYLFIENLPCRKDADPGMPPWCGLETCIVEEHRCMRQIGVQSVLSTCEKLIRKTSD